VAQTIASSRETTGTFGNFSVSLQGCPGYYRAQIPCALIAFETVLRIYLSIGLEKLEAPYLFTSTLAELERIWRCGKALLRWTSELFKDAYCICIELLYFYWNTAVAETGLLVSPQNFFRKASAQVSNFFIIDIVLSAAYIPHPACLALFIFPQHAWAISVNSQPSLQTLILWHRVREVYYDGQVCQRYYLIRI
jgi:hypothetical protein